MKWNLLSLVDKPEDIRKMSVQELELLAEEIRSFLVESISKTGGHLASNLGVVELTLAIHKVFRSPEDKILWDVGHQSYVHKILTGRKDWFDTLRMEDGMSGFPKPKESEHDAFISGHSSTSISAGYGIMEAMELCGDSHYVVSVIGDGSFTGGMVYEAMNNAGRKQNNMIVILNHNDMSISKNVGAFAKYLASIRSKPGYIKLKRGTEKALGKVPVVGSSLKKSLRSSKSMLKSVLYHSTWFEEMGFAYLGPVNGHDISDLVRILRLAKQSKGPVLVHVDTVKGKGYSYAEENPGAYHGISKFDVETGNPDIAAEDSFSGVFGKTLTEFAGLDRKICAVTAAMKYGTGLQYFSAEYKSRFYDVGIAEQHAVTFCAGLASQGMRPVFAVYSSFLQRGFDQIIHDCAIEGQHVVFGIDRAGIVGDDGETHQGMFDVSFLGTVPGVTLFAPETYEELRISLQRALYETEGIAAVRYPRGSERATHLMKAQCKDDYLYSEKQGGKLLITYGRITDEVMKAADRLEDVSVLKLLRIIPLPEKALAIASRYETVFFVEEGFKNGGIGEKMLCSLFERGFRGHFEIRAVQEEFIRQANYESVLTHYGLDADSIVEMVSNGGDSER